MWYNERIKTKKENSMNELQTYETVVTEQGRGAILRRLAWVLGYVIFFSLFIVWSATQGISFPILILGALLTGSAVLFTWKYTSLEYEYSVTGNYFSLAKIYGKRTRKAVWEIDLKRATLIAPCTEEYRSQAEKSSPSRILHVTSQADAPNTWLLLWNDEAEDANMVLIFEANDKLLSILRRVSPRALPREVKLAVNDRTVAQ